MKKDGAIRPALDELAVLCAKGQITFLGGVVVTPEGLQRVMCGKADPLHVTGSFEYMKMKVLLQEMQDMTGSVEAWSSTGL